jgi:3-oxoacyl-[acyl-carrier-protein] synthase II
VYAKVGGVGLSSDAYHITSPDPEGTGQVTAMRFAMEDAGVTTSDVVHVNAHATSTKVGDLTETASIRKLFGSDADHVQLSATKSMTGHLLGGAGAIESVFAVKAVAERLAPPTINVENPDPELQVPLVRNEPAKLPGGDIAAINNSFGFGGHNVALVIQNA